MKGVSSTKSNEDLIDRLQQEGNIQSRVVKQVMLAVDRKNYFTISPYGGIHISLPYKHAHALEMLKDHLFEGGRALDVGSGSGYITACMALMVYPSGKVVGIDRLPEVINISKENINKDQPGFLKTGVIEFIVGDGKQGYENLAPYNAIHVGVASKTIPRALVNQLKIGGRMIISVECCGGGQTWQVVDKMEDGIKMTMQMCVTSIEKDHQHPH